MQLSGRGSLFVGGLSLYIGGVDLIRTQRKVSRVNEKKIFMVQTKGWKFPKWEEVIVLEESPSISPWHLMKNYVERTSNSVPSGGKLLWSLDLKKPLSSNRVNSLTKEVMKEFGISVDDWKPHSPRRAGVLWWKNGGMQVEEVQKLGAWKHFGAFQVH